MKKYIYIGVGILFLSIVLVFSGCDIGVVPSTGQSKISSLEKGVSDKCLPAPAVASLLLKEAGYHKGGGIGNYIKNVTNEMGPGTDFHDIDKCDENYAYVVAVFLIGQGAQVNIPNPVYNETKNLYYETIQGAIDDAGNGNKIWFARGPTMKTSYSTIRISPCEVLTLQILLLWLPRSSTGEEAVL